MPEQKPCVTAEHQYTSPANDAPHAPINSIIAGIAGGGKGNEVMP